ncbi:hypothetical protein [Methylobacterium sp. AMS5]|uniref:hypothetical protein n=1 Tax=Methylobacterium sp. AMS5 TaxID=925818 RepID=UPI00074F954C|nr:hypothetical protein [Methylobacterium sp. AMS5]AMB45061.1 hypothetical protein Y590_09145 [Methylobacterium sp. AMS5]
MSPSTLPSQSDRAALQRAHIALLHPQGSRGQVCTARAARDGHGWDEGLVAPSSKAISEQLAAADVEYAGQLRFTGRRHSACVTGIGSGYLDLDFYKPNLPYADATAEEVASILIGAFEAAGVPCPSFVQDSGQGAYTIWAFTQSMDGQALPRWQAAMKGLRGPVLDADGNLPKRRGAIDPKLAAFETRMLPLWRVLRDLGLDRGAIDPARVLRVMGALNPKTGRMSCLAWPSSIQDIERIDFDAWCDALVPYTRAELRQLRAEREVWKSANPDYVKVERRPRRLSGSKWALVLGDLMRLLDHRGANWFKANRKRDWWCLISATAISMTSGGTAEEWAERLAPMIGLPIGEVTASLSGVERGMQAHQAGERREWNGAERPSFYDFSYATIIDRMSISADEAVEAGLRVLVPGGATPLTAAERQRASRTARAVVRAPRDVQAEERMDWGAYALMMRRDGATYSDLVEAFGKSEDTIRRAIREAEAALSEPALAPVVVPSLSEPVQTPDDTSHHIVVVDPSEPAAPADEVPVKVRFTPFYAEYRTSTAAWAEVRERIGRDEHGRDRWRIEHRWDLPLMPVAAAQMPHVGPRRTADDAFCLAVMGQVARAAATDRRALRRGSARLSARPLALAPLDAEADVRRYREASGR